MKKRFGLMTAFGALLFPITALTNEDIPEVLKRYSFPEIDSKNVQFLPDGHMGKNKPRYGNFQWRVVESSHFLIYTYDTSEDAAEMYLAEAERTFKDYSKQFTFNSFSEKIRVTIYNTTQDFEETNLVPGLVPKGLGGLTEIQRWRRVVIAFRGSVVGFSRLIRHELAHRYHIEILLLMGHVKDFPPLWFIEGAAEHFSHGRDTYEELVMRSAYLANSLASTTDSYWHSTALVYRQGKFVMDFLAERYKDKGEVISQIFAACRENKFEAAFQKVTGETPQEFQKALSEYVESRYSPLRIKKDLLEQSRPVDNGAVLASSGPFFVTKKMKLGRTVLVLNWTDGANIVSEELAEDGRLKNVALRGFPLEISPEFGFSEQGASFGPNNTVVYAVDVSGRDIVRVQHFAFDSKTKKFKLGEEVKYAPEGIRYIQHPILIGPDKLAFLGRSDLFSEVYLYNLITHKLQKLTSAKRNYRGLTYSKARNALVTSAENNLTESYDLVYGDLSTERWHFLMETSDNEYGPEFSPDGQKLLYVSDKGLVQNLYLYDLTAKTLAPLTDMVLTAFNPKWFSEKWILFNGVADGDLTAFLAPLPVMRTANALVSKPAAEKFSDAPFRALLGNIDYLTVIQEVISPDKTKALFVVNRILSMDKIKKKDDVVGFYLVNLEDNSIAWYLMGVFKQVHNFESAEFLTGTNILLTGRFLSANPTDNTIATYLFVFDWQTEKIIRLGDWERGARFGVESISSPMLQRTSDQRYLAFVKDKRVSEYDVMEKKIIYEKDFKRVIDIKLLSRDCLLVVQKPTWLENSNLRLWNIDTFRNVANNFELDEYFVSWHALPDNRRLFLITKTKDKKFPRFSIRIFDAENNGVGLVRSDLTDVKNVRIVEENLVLDTNDPLAMTLTISKNGTTSAEIKNPAHVPAAATRVVEPKTIMSSQIFPISPSFPKKVYKPSKFPKMYAGQVGIESDFGTHIAAGGSLLALDIMNDRAFQTDFSLNYRRKTDWNDGGLSGFGTANYYNFAAGYSLGIDYWHRNPEMKKLEASFSQNIFLHELLNWDVTLREQSIEATRYRFDDLGFITDAKTRKWLRSYLGTTFSVDTTTDDWHGPVSGNAVFLSVEAGANSSLAYQCLDLNIDARHYLPFSVRTGLALRFAGGTSLGPNPDSFVWGGNKTFRGIPLFSQSGNSYVLQSTELRVPLFDFIRAKGSSPIVDVFLFPFTTTVDARGGIYNDLGDMWNKGEGLFDGDHRGFNLQSSTGVFLNIPTALGMTLRFNWGLAGKKDMNFWVGRNF